MDHSALVSQALSAPPYLLATVIVLVTSYLSDRSRDRTFYILLHALLSGFGYIFIAIMGALRADSKWRYLGMFPSCAGFFSCISLLLTLQVNNQRSRSAQGTGVAMLNLVGQLGPLVGVRLYPDSDKPYYVRGMAVCGGFMMGVAVLTLILRRMLIKGNEKMRHEYQQVGAQGRKQFTSML